MSQTGWKTVGVVLAGGALAASLAACGGSDSSDPAAKRLHDAVLVESDFPSGYTVVKLGQDDKTAITDQLDDSRKNAEVTPKACAPKESAPAASESGSVVAINGAATLSQSVAKSTLSAEELTARVSGECASVSVAINAGPAKGTTVTIKNSDVAPITVDGHTGVTLRQVTSAADKSRELLVARVPVNGYLVTVHAAMADGAAPDQAAFDATVKAAVARAASSE